MRIGAIMGLGLARWLPEEEVQELLVPIITESRSMDVVAFAALSLDWSSLVPATRSACRRSCSR